MNTPLTPNKTESDVSQLDLGLQEPRINYYYQKKHRISLWFRYFETVRFVRSLHTWVILGASIAILILQFYYIQKFNELLPPRIPLFQYFINLEDRLISKNWIYLIPGFSIFTAILVFIPAFKWFNRREIAASFTLLFMLFSIILFTYSLIQLIGNYKIA